MRIERDTIVTLACDVRDCDGKPVDDDGAEIVYLHGGYDGIFAKIESALHGREVGYELRLTLGPEDAFGDYDAQLLRVEPRDKFPKEIDVGMQFEGVPGEREEDARIYTVTDLTDDAVVVDGNHPLAGERLWFHVIVKAVRKATDDEIEAENVSAPVVSVE